MQNRFRFGLIFGFYYFRKPKKINIMSRRNLSEINAGSMADIAFLLLIFFLVSTTMQVDQGILRKLPPDGNDQGIIKKRNILTVLVNRENNLLVKNEVLDIRELKSRAKDFIKNANDDIDLPLRENIEVDFFGEVLVTKKHVISLQTDRGTSYEMYVAVQNELVAAYSELRDELAQEKWKVNFESLPVDHKNAIEKIYPLKISEADPN